LKSENARLLNEKADLANQITTLTLMNNKYIRTLPYVQVAGNAGYSEGTTSISNHAGEAVSINGLAVTFNRDATIVFDNTSYKSYEYNYTYYNGALGVTYKLNNTQTAATGGLYGGTLYDQKLDVKAGDKLTFYNVSGSGNNKISYHVALKIYLLP